MTLNIMASNLDNKILGTLCARGHDHNGLGQSLRYKKSSDIKGNGQGACVECGAVTTSLRTQDDPDKYYEIAKRSRIKRREKANQWHREHYAVNKDEINAKHRAYYQLNKEKAAEKGRRRFNKDRAAHYRYQNAYVREQRVNNTQFAIGIRLRSLVSQAFRKYTATGKIMVSKKYGIDYKAIIAHLGPHPNTIGIEGKFHVDHIIPVSAFDLTDLEQVLIAFAPSNHRWLLAHENRLKNRFIPEKEIVPTEMLAMLEKHNIGIYGHG